jgi:hypothetical protein
MAHDHGEKIHWCQPCGYWKVAGGRFSTCECPKCHQTLNQYSSRKWIIDNIDKKFEAIPVEKTRNFSAKGFI